MSQTPAASSTRDIDREVWSLFTATVAADDIVGMGRIYHPDAVLVTPKATTPIKETLDRWGKDTPQVVPFEALLGKTDGRRRVLMEWQLAAVTQAEWDKLPK